MKTDDIRHLVEDDDPVDIVWELLWDVWSPAAEDIASQYEREQSSVSVEWSLYNVYQELYTEVLPDRCVTEPSLSVPEDGALVVMDAMSVREAPLFIEALDDAGYQTDVGYEYATVPSETIPFRERVGYANLKKQYDTEHASSYSPSLDGDEQIVWAPYPDSLAENIQAGKTEIGTVEEMYEKTEQTLLSILSQLDADQVVVRSDHGYVRLESGYGFPSSDHHRSRMQEVFSGGRHVSVGETDASDLVEEGIVVEEDGYYVPVGRFTWPARGKYSTYQHGGLGLTEVLTPSIEINL
jgi:hypothetical protein